MSASRRASRDMSSFIDFDLRQFLFLLILLLQVFTSLSVTVNKVNNIPTATRIIELKAVTINCLLNDIVRISAPVINEKSRYYLLKPNGDTIKLNINLINKLDIDETNSSENLITAKFYPNTSAIIEQTVKIDVFNIRKFKKKVKYLEPNEFLLGPLLEEDYGNWILSIYTKDSNDQWIEIFQTFTMAIAEYIQLKSQKRTLHLGETLQLSFAYPIPGIETCEIVAPKSTFDRFYTRRIVDFNKCTFIIPNITQNDEGVWRIIGVGRTIKAGAVLLNVIKDLVYLI